MSTYIAKTMGWTNYNELPPSKPGKYLVLHTSGRVEIRGFSTGEWGSYWKGSSKTSHSIIYWIEIPKLPKWKE